MTPKQKMFVLEYMKDLNATQAAIRAGYSERTASFIGHENLNKPYIQQAITEATKSRCERVEISADYVLASLKNVAERCQQAEPVYDKEGNPIGEYKFDSSGANKSLELLGKHLKLFADRLDLSVPQGIYVVIKRND